MPNLKSLLMKMIIKMANEIMHWYSLMKTLVKIFWERIIFMKISQHTTQAWTLIIPTMHYICNLLIIKSVNFQIINEKIKIRITQKKTIIKRQSHLIMVKELYLTKHLSILKIHSHSKALTMLATTKFFRIEFSTQMEL